MVRSWIRQALRASGVAILVPAAVAAAIALSVVGGGHNVASLGEVLRGPATPPAEAAAPPAQPRGRTHELPVQLRGQTPQLQRQVATAAPRRPAPAPRRPPARKPSPRPPAPRPPGPAPAPAPPAPAQPAPAQPPPRPHPIHDTGTAVAETLEPLPLAGPAAADAVEAVVNLVDPA